MKVLWVLAFVATTANALRFEVQCPPEQEENWEIEMLLPHPDCDKFYKCTFGQPVEQRCPSGLYFNLDSWQCDWKENVDCTDRNVPGETTPAATTPAPTTPAPTTPAPTTPAPTTPRPTTPQPTTPQPTTPQPTTPQPTTPQPTTPQPTTPQPTTPQPTTPRPTTPQPTTPEPTTLTSTTDCELEPEPTLPPQPQPTPGPDFLENGCPQNPNIHWLLPHEVDCNLFYYCVWGRKVQRQCPSSLHFNRKIQVCDWPINAGCPTSYNKHIEKRGFIIREF